MANNAFDLLTPAEAEEEFGKKYFYRQRIYRLGESGKIKQFTFRNQTCFLGSQILKAMLNDLELKISSRFPAIDMNSIRVFYDQAHGKRIVVDGLFGKGISVETDLDAEEDILNKIGHVLEWMGSDSIETDEVDELSTTQMDTDDSLADVLPEEIVWVKVDTSTIEEVEVKSLILVSLPSIAQFIGIKSDKFTEWLLKTTFSDFVLSIHPKQIHDPQISGSWKRGIRHGLVPLIPFELLPEIIVTLRQSNRTTSYPEKAEMLYQLAKTTLEAVGLAISGSKSRAAEELAKVGKGLGLNVADQIIGIFKQYESRDYQIQTNKEFNSKVKEVGQSYAVVSGSLTLGITGRSAERWRLLGVSRQLPFKQRNTGREVMRTLSPSDSVGMTFGERHYTKKPDVAEAVTTGKQGKDFYERLKNVGLLDD